MFLLILWSSKVVWWLSGVCWFCCGSVSLLEVVLGRCSMVVLGGCKPRWANGWIRSQNGSRAELVPLLRDPLQPPDVTVGSSSGPSRSTPQNFCSFASRPWRNFLLLLHLTVMPLTGPAAATRPLKHSSCILPPGGALPAPPTLLSVFWSK